MKKILTSLALAGIIGPVAYAQENVDLKPFAIMIPDQILGPGKPISPTGIVNNLPAPADSIQGAIVYAIDSSGGTLTATDTFAFFGPWSVLSPAPESGISFNVGFSQDGTDIEAGVGGANIFYLDNSWVALTDSINTLLNIQYFEENGIGNPFEDMLYRRSELVDGQTYGWYAHMRPYPDWDEGTFTDIDQTNNWSYTPVIWQGGATGIKDLLKNTHYTSLSIYPNPTTDKISFVLDFTKANKSTVVRLLDITGRSLNSKALGSAGAGTQEYSYDVENLPAGSYTLQVITDNAISVGKFVKK